MTHQLHIIVDMYGFAVVEQYATTRRQLCSHYKSAAEAYKFWEALIRLSKPDYDQWLTINGFPLLDQQRTAGHRSLTSVILAIHNIEAKDINT